MVNILQKLRNIKSINRDAEAGNSFVLYLLMFPVVFSAFGLAIDTTVATYTQTSLQSNLDAATQSTLSRAVNPGATGNLATQPTLSPEAAQTNLINIYDTNRSSGEQPFVMCQSTPVWSSQSETGTATLISPPSRCGFTLTDYVYRDSGGTLYLRASLTEQSKPVFLQFLGVNAFTYNITSEARTGYAIR